MDADSSYGGSDTAQDSHSGHDNSSSLETTHNDVTHQQEPNNFYHKNEITLPVNYDETDFQDNKPIKQPHYLSTANLNINDTLEHHSNLEEMSKNYKSTSYLNESPKTINKSDVGVDNPAFQEEEYKPEVKSTFDHNKPYNGDLNSSAILGLTSPNKNEEPLTEAVNLELINLKPVGKDVTGAYENGNGMTSIPVKKESDAEIGNPYDEYFVPVNEHRKYMRGEKLYVTMDKRNKKKRNKCLCWGLCLCIVAAAVIIGILAAVGVIGNQGPHPAQEVSARHFGSSSSEPEVKTGGIFGLPKEVTQETTIPPETSSRFTPGPPVVTVSNLLPTTETSMIQVPRALESQLVIDNLQFTPALADKNSTEFKKLAEALETELKNSLFSSDTLNYGASNIEVKIVDFTPGSVVVKYRITWVFKDGIHGAKDPIDEEMLKKKMKNILNRNNGFMDTYHIDDNTVTVERILDLCKIENNGCEYNCSFDYETADFVCSCPEGKYLGSDRKSCMDETVIEPKNINFHEDDLYATENPHFVQEPSSEPEPTSVPDYHHHENEASPEPEPTSEPITEPKPTEIHHIIINEPSAEPEPTSEPVAEPKPTEIHHIINEPSAEPEPTSEPITEGKPTETHHNIIVETSPEPEPTIKPTGTHYHIIAEPSAEPEPTSEPEPEPTNKPEEVSHENYINLHELEVVPIPTTEPNVEPHPEPTSEPNPEPTAEPAAEPNAEPTVEPAAEPTLVSIAEPSPEPTAEPAAEPNAEPTAEPAAEPSPEPNAVPAAEPTAEPAAEPSPETTIQPIAEPSPEPTAEPGSEPELKPIVGLIPESTSPEPTPEPKTEPITESNPEPTVLPKLNPEPASQPNPEPTTEVIEPKSEPVSEHITESLPEFAIEHRTEPVAEPTPESVIIHKTEPITEVRTEHPTENKSEPVAEPTAEPNLDHETTSSATLEHLSENKIEFASEPNTEHTIQPEMKMEITTQMVNHEINLTSEPNIEPSPVPIVPHVNPLIIETTTKLENEDSISSTESMTISPMTVSPMTSSSMSPTTMKSTESEFRHNHLSEEIFAEPEITTMTNQQVEEVSKTTTIKNNESNTIENSVTTSVPNVEVKEEAVPTTLLPIFEVKKETPVTTSLPASEIKENSPITTTTAASDVHPTTSVSNSEVPVTSMVNPDIKMDEKLTTTKPEMTTQPTLIETTINNQNHSENVIPVSVNEQTYHLVHSQNTTEESVTNPVTVPMIFNNEHVILHSDNVEVKNETSKPDMVETTPSSTDMSKIFTEIHKVMDDNFDHSTEMVAVEATNHTHMNMGVMDSTENTSAMDNMSPFLPELGNDTFVNKLHLGEHIIPPIQNETHDDEIIETSPPRLDNDQMNVTNPKDTNPTDTPLQVVPLEGTENEIVDKEISTQTPKSEEKMKVTEPQFVPVMVIQEATPTTTMSSVNLLESIKDNATENSIEITTKPLDSVKIESTTKSSEEIVKTTLPSEIINNVHSNNYFETLLRPHREENATSSQSPQQNILTSFSTSTEDLIALETTTNGGKMAENKNVGVETTTETSKRNESATTVHAEILTTVRESVNFANNTDENSTKVVDSTATATKTDEANITKAEESNSTIIEDNNLTISAEVTTVPSPQNKSHQYEVQETFSDVTTTEKLFLSTKATTEVPVIIKEAYEDLSVVPLNSDDDNETSKIEEKRVAPTTTFGQLDAEPNDSTNDISQEEQSVLEKFHHNFNEINGESDKSEDSTTSKVDEISESNTELGHELFKYDTYNETKLKKNKDKAKFDKKAKLEKAISANDEILTTSLPSDKQPAPFSDVKPVTEDFTISGFSRCVFGQFQCINGTNTKDGSYCISVNDRCDSVDDCSDASDEIDCIKNGCPNNFQCDSGQCLKRHLVCDGIQHCNDGSDETNCDQWNCRFDEFSCGEKLRCIPVSWKCDGRMQCPNGSDEYNCPSTICNENSFHCLEQNTCVPKSWMCDGKADCVNAEDEKSCECGNDEFKCAIGGGCIKNHQRCDGTDDCADRSDEWKCMRLEEVNNKKYLQIEFSNNTWFPVCSDNWNQTHSDLVCRNLGYGGSSLTETVAKPDGDFKGYFKLKNQLTYGSPILSQIEKSDSCDNFISISCQEFTCGSQSTLDVQSARIIGGNRGTETQWPSLTLLYNKKHNIQCTATLIAPLWVMASHSCIFNPFSQNPNKPKDWILYAGNTNFFSNHDNSTTQVGQIKHIFAHPQAKFSQFDFANDVVLVELVKPLTMTRNVSAMCLPDKDIEPRQLCIIAGWGVSKPGEPGKNQYLHYLPVPIIDLDGCNSTKHYNGLISKGKICAGYTDSEKTPCYNDEGAPLMCFSDSAGTWELQGILSHHDNCARSKHPAIYTAINEKIRQWVINTIGQKPARSA